MATSNRGNPAKGTKTGVFYRVLLEGTDDPIATGKASGKTNRNGSAGIVIPLDLDPDRARTVVIEVSVVTASGTRVNGVITRAFVARKRDCNRNNTTACLEDGIGARVRTSKGQALQVQGSTMQRATFANQNGTVDVLDFDLCRDPNYFSRQIQIRDNYDGGFVVEMWQVDTGWVKIIYPPLAGTIVNLLGGGPPCGPFKK